MLCVASAAASAATGNADLRWILSPSSEAVGYIVYVGNEPGFFDERASIAQVDIGSNFTLTQGVAHYPLSSLISQSSWIVMTAYDSEGFESAASNQIYAEIQVACAVDADCDDDNFCNGAESCSGGVCSSNAPPVCASAGQCSVASCDPLAGCLVDPAPDGLWCDDGDAATSSDVCTAGVCIGEDQSDGSSEPFYFEDFQASPDGADPVGWFDTGSGNSSEPSDDFRVFAMSDGNHVMQTTSRETNIHSHLVDGGSVGWSGYEFSGRMRIDVESGAIGVTLYSGYPNSDSYYRLRRYGSRSFYLAPHTNVSSTCLGNTDTNVRPEANRWYAFRFRAFPEVGGTRVQAKVWDSLTAEPAAWQADCLDPVASALTGGAPGVWSMGTGAKSWDDLAIRSVSIGTEIPPDPEPAPECLSDNDCGDANACNGAERCVAGSCVVGIPLTCTGSEQCSFSSCDPALGCVVEAVPNGRACNDQNLCTGYDRCQAGVCSAGTAISCPAPNSCQVGLCDPLAGCSVENLPDGSLCDDGDPSTLDDRCSVGACVGAPTEEPEPEPGPEPEPEPEPNAVFYFEDFESYALGEDPDGWFDSRRGNSLEEDPSRFAVMQLADGNRVFGTDSADGNIHSHYVADESTHWAEYEYRGRMRISSWSSGIGVTLYSDYPNSDSYYRLRSYGGRAFELDSHPNDILSCVDSTSTGMAPVANTWVRFRFQAFDEGDGTRVRAKVWAAAETEPEQWQVDCSTTGYGSFYSGSPGVWSMYGGSKYWDDLEVFALGEVELDEPAWEPPVDNGTDAFYFEDFESYRNRDDAEGWLDTAARNSTVEDPRLFSVFEQSDGNRALATSSLAPDIHSHLLEGGSEYWRDYEYSGRMQFERDPSGIGVTLYSDYPNSDSYYRLGRSSEEESTNGGAFQLSGHPHGSEACVGLTDSGVVPVPDVWYRFRFQALTVGIASHLRAKVWSESGSEPADWQIDCAVAAPIAISSGRPGVWATGRGDKLWDDLEVEPTP